jgi:uncharacterized membrane protein YgdD (TMEM256/DUF423 family)
MFFAVALGAFGAHGLRGRLSPALQEVFETAVRYHVYHALSLFAVAWLSQAHPHRFVTSAGYAFAAGVLLFSGSLYLLSLTGVTAWGAVTPFGGLAFLAGWGLLGATTLRR